MSNHKWSEGYDRAVGEIKSDGFRSVMENIDVRPTSNCEIARGYIDGIIDYAESKKDVQNIPYCSADVSIPEYESGHLASTEDIIGHGFRSILMRNIISLHFTDEDSDWVSGYLNGVAEYVKSLEECTARFIGCPQNPSDAPEKEEVPG